MNNKESLTNKRPRVSTMDTDKDTIAAATIVDIDMDNTDFGRYSKLEAPSLEIFLGDPTMYRPRGEFLAGPASYVEVRHIVRSSYRLSQSLLLASA